MSTQILTDRLGHTIGRIEESSGKMILKDKYGFKKGTYDPKSNLTTDERGHRVGTGNLLALLLTK